MPRVTISNEVTSPYRQRLPVTPNLTVAELNTEWQ